MRCKTLNLEFKEKFTVQLLRSAKELFAGGLVMSSSFGRYSAVMLHLATSQIPETPIINMRLDGETEATKRHREHLQERLNLNLKIFDIDCDKAFTLKNALEALEARALISGVLWEETENREGFEYFMDDRTFGVQRIYPLLHWKQQDMVHYIRVHNLPINHDYTDSFKDRSDKKECGIHLFRDGAGI